MELFLWSMVGGIVGTGLMDIADRLMDRARFTTGGA